MQQMVGPQKIDLASANVPEFCTIYSVGDPRNLGKRTTVVTGGGQPGGSA